MLTVDDCWGCLLKYGCHELANSTPNNQIFHCSQTLNGILGISVSRVIKMKSDSKGFYRCVYSGREGRRGEIRREVREDKREKRMEN